MIGTQRNAVGRAAYFGAKPWNCDIVIHQDRLAHVGRHSTLLHEIFHSFSVGLNELDFDLARGWEEGVVEACTRLFRDSLMAAAGLPPASDIRTSYNRYLPPLESLRIRTLQAEPAFYLGLLAAPLAGREAAVLQWIHKAEPTNSPAQIALDTDTARQELRR